MSERRLIDSPRGWLTVVATFFSSAVALGAVYSFGAFFQSMADDFGTVEGLLQLFLVSRLSLSFG